MSDNEFEDDIVFARFLNYMQIALLHKIALPSNIYFMKK